MVLTGFDPVALALLAPRATDCATGPVEYSLVFVLNLYFCVNCVRGIVLLSFIVL